MRSAPWLCVEILSPADSAGSVLAKVEESLRFSVDWVWVVQPESGHGQVHSAQTVTAVVDRIFRAGDLAVDLANVDY